MSSSTYFKSKISSQPFSSDSVEEKQELMEEAEQYKEKLEKQWKGIKSEAGQYGKQALIIGGVVTTSYLLMRAVLPKNKKEKSLKEDEKVKIVAPKKSSYPVKGAIQSLVWTLAVGWAQQKLKKYIADDGEPDENSKY